MFVVPMECLPVAKVPESGQLTYELKLDGIASRQWRRKIERHSTRDAATTSQNGSTLSPRRLASKVSVERR